MKKVSKKWRSAYPDCRELVSLLDNVNENFHGIFDVKRAGYMVIVDLAIAIVLLIVSLFWNAFYSPKITPEVFMLAVSIAVVSILVIYFVYCIYNINEAKNAKKRITEYQAIWPAILEVVEENKNNLLLPPEPLKARDIEVRAGVVMDDKFARGARIKAEIPRVEAEVVQPLGISKKMTMDELIEDPVVADLLSPDVATPKKVQPAKKPAARERTMSELAEWCRRETEKLKKEASREGRDAV